MTDALQLTNCSAIAERAEVLAKNEQHENKYDVVITRAVAPLDELMMWSVDLLKKGGSLSALKGGDILQEIERTKRIKFITNIDVCSLGLNGFNDFVSDEKKLVRVTIN
jgi:16S rRNA G527 N7-methylase RsmG